MNLLLGSGVRHFVLCLAVWSLRFLPEEEEGRAGLGGGGTGVSACTSSELIGFSQLSSPIVLMEGTNDSGRPRS